jgi:hypothetical protein
VDPVRVAAGRPATSGPEKTDPSAAAIRDEMAETIAEAMSPSSARAVGSESGDLRIRGILGNGHELRNAPGRRTSARGPGKARAISENLLQLRQFRAGETRVCAGDRRVRTAARHLDFSPVATRAERRVALPPSARTLTAVSVILHALYLSP